MDREHAGESAAWRQLLLDHRRRGALHEPGVVELGAVEERAFEDRIGQVGAGEIGAREIRVREVGLPEIGADELESPPVQSFLDDLKAQTNIVSLDQFACVEFIATSTVTVGTNAYVQVFLVQSADDTNYEDAPATTNPMDFFCC